VTKHASIQDAEVLSGLRLREHDTLFYAGDWHRPIRDAVQDVCSPATGERIARVSLAGKEDVDRAVKAATMAPCVIIGERAGRANEHLPR
jgi:hypothetical protein